MKIKALVVGTVLGAIIFLLGTQLVAYTTAIAAPGFLAEMMRSDHYGMFIYFAWEVLVVGFLGVGVISIIITGLASKYLPFSDRYKIIGIFIGMFGLIYLLTPNQGFSMSLEAHIYELVFIVCVFIGVYLGRKRVHA